MPKEPKPNFSQDRLDADLEKRIEEIAKTDPFQSHQTNRQPWTPQETKIIKAAAGKITYKAMRKYLLPNRTIKALKHKVKDLRENGSLPSQES